MSVTLVEAAKHAQGRNDTVLSAIIELYAQSSDILQALPFIDIQGNALKYSREETLPGIGFRGVNGSYTESTGIVNPVTETLVIAGGDLDVDKFIVDTMGSDIRGAHEAMKIKALAGRWTKEFLKGDNETDPTVFSGLQARIQGDQLISAGATDGGEPLSLGKLDELIDAVDNPTGLIMNKMLMLSVSKLQDIMIFRFSLLIRITSTMIFYHSQKFLPAQPLRQHLFTV
jgi:hypothetical protein